MSTPRSGILGHALPPIPGGTRDDFEEPTQPQIDYRPVIKPVLQYELYNPSDKPMHFSKAGEDFYLPARDKRWRGKDPSNGQTITYPKPGVLPVWGIADQRITALQVVQAAVGEDGVSGSVGINGVRVLFGDERDSRVAEDARAGWIRKQLADWTITTQNHERAVKKAQDNGETAPHPPRLVKEAYEGLARYGNESEEYLQVRCETCNWGFPDEESKWKHVLGMHRDRKAEAERALKLESTEMEPQVEQVPVPPPPKMPTAEEIDAALSGEEPPEGAPKKPKK